MTDKLFNGVYAAVLTPRHDDGALDLSALRALIAFLRERGVTRYAVNGATGEFCLTDTAELHQVLETVQAEGGPGTEILCGVGAAGLAGTLASARVAEEMKVQGLLLSMPYFFPYTNADLYAFSVGVAAATPLPILLYNLPQFTSGLDAQTVCDLVRNVPTIVGVKDSSGSLEIVTALTEQLPHACRIIGNDSVLAEALTGGLCDGVVSGVACALPEVINGLFAAEPGGAAFHTCADHLQTFIEHLNVLPTPWGVKVAAQARAVLQARFSLPLSAERAQQAEEFEEWLKGWLPALLGTKTN